MYSGSVRAFASHAEDWRFESQPTQTNDIANLYVSLRSLVLGINRIGERTVRFTIRILGLSGMSGHGTSSLVPQCGSTMKVAMRAHYSSWY